ncbi:MAG: hypothetical protein ACOYJA_06435 [Christensenellales bacterium]|jgi:hypothetical protein
MSELRDPVYDRNIHRTGRVWMLIGLAVMMCVPLAISIYLGAWPRFADIMGGFLPLFMIYGPVAVIEILTYSPMLGSGGTYLGFVTGNLSNLKVPCALNAMQIAGVKPATKEGEVISTLAVAASSLVTNVMLIIGVLLLAQLTPILESPALAPAFANILPALFGALGVVYIARNWKVAVAPILAMILIFIIAPAAPISILIPIGALIAIGVARVLYNRDRKKEGKIA